MQINIEATAGACSEMCEHEQIRHVLISVITALEGLLDRQESGEEIPRRGEEIIAAYDEETPDQPNEDEFCKVAWKVKTYVELEIERAAR